MPRSSNPAAFNRSLKDRIRNETTPRGRTSEQLRREFFLQRFLARVFSEPGERWLLKGGASLLVRRPDARYSQDIDNTFRCRQRTSFEQGNIADPDILTQSRTPPRGSDQRVRYF